MRGPSLLERQMKNGGGFQQRSEAPDRADDVQALFRRLGEAINQATTLEELFRRVAAAVRGILPDHVMSLALRNAEAKFVRTQFVACQDQILAPRTQMPFRRFCRALQLPDGRRYLDHVPAKLWPLLFPNLTDPAPAKNLPNNTPASNLNVRSRVFTPTDLRQQPPPLEKHQNESNGAASQPFIKVKSGSLALTYRQIYPSALLVSLRDLSGLYIHSVLPNRHNRQAAISRYKTARTAELESILGCLAIVSRQANAFAPHHGAGLAALADLFVAGIYKVQLLQERKHAVHSFQEFAEVSNEMGTATDLDTALQHIAQAATRLLPIPAAGIAVFELTTVGDLDQSSISPLDEKGGVAAGERLVSRSAVAPDANAPTLADWPKFPFRTTRGIFKRLLRHQPLVVHDVAKSRILSEAAKTTLAQHQIHSYFGIPIFLDPLAGQNANTCTTPLALLSLYVHAPQELEGLDTAMLRALAAHAALVLAKVRLQHQLINNASYFDGLRRNSMEELENFVYVISHNLKTPVVSIQGFANILHEEVGPSLEIEHLHFLERIQKNAAAMEKMVLDLLEFSRLGRTPIKLEHVNVKDLVQGVIDEMCWLGQADATAFVLPRSLAGLPSIWADGAGLKIVFENLLSNAAKYRRPEVPLRIEIGWEAQPRFYVFWVRDNGVGMAPAFQAKAFDLFQRGPEVGQIAGTGVGLSIVRRLVKNHQGLVRLHSKLGEGTTIYFTLPKIDAPSE